MTFVAMEKEVCPMYYICTTFMEKKLMGPFEVDRLTGTVGQRLGGRYVGGGWSCQVWSCNLVLYSGLCDVMTLL